MKQDKLVAPKLVGFHYVEDEYVSYNIGLIADCALEALQVAVLAIEQCATKKELVTSLDIGDFYNWLTTALEQENGQGVMSEPGAMASLQDEIQGLIDIVARARNIAKQPSRRSGGSCAACNGSGVAKRKHGGSRFI